MDLIKLAEEIIAGKRLKREDDLNFFFTADLEELRKGAALLQDYFCGKKVDLCTIMNARSGRCSENCKFCAQSAHHHTGVDEYGFVEIDEIMEMALANQAEGADRFGLVTSGRRLDGEDFEHAIEAYKKMKANCSISLCAGHGLLRREQFKRLREAGVESYHENIETSRRNFPNICTTHKFEDKLETMRIAKEEGFCVCSGGIIGMGETWEDRLDMALTLAELGIESIPINALMPIPGTPLGHLPGLAPEDILRTVAFFLYLNPAANIRLAAGRKMLPQNGREAFCGGASATITGNMLTTSGSNIKEDIAMLHELGFNLNA